MPFYRAEAIDSTGKSKQERVEAQNEQEAVSILQKRNLTVVELRAADAPAPASATPKKLFGGGIPMQIILSFYEQLGFLIKSGIPMYLSIKMLLDTLKHAGLNRVLKSVLFELSEGFPLSGALQKFPEQFPPLHTNLINVGEKSGNLDSALAHLIDLVREQQEIREKVIKAAAYPIFLLFLSFSLVFGLLLFVFPKFEEIFKAFGVKLPFLTEFLIQTSQQLRSNTVVIFSTIGVIGFAIIYFFRSEQTSEARDKFLLKIPIISDVFVSMFVALFTKTLCSLLKAGIPLLEGLTICQNTIRGKLKHDFFAKLIETVREGEKVSKSMETTKLIPEMARQLVIVGESTGTLDAMLENIFLFYKKRYNEMLEKTTAVVQPILLLFAAVLIAVVAIALFVPLFKLGGAMRSGG